MEQTQLSKVQKRLGELEELLPQLEELKGERFLIKKQIEEKSNELLQTKKEWRKTCSHVFYRVVESSWHNWHGGKPKTRFYVCCLCKKIRKPKYTEDYLKRNQMTVVYGGRSGKYDPLAGCQLQPRSGKYDPLAGCRLHPRMPDYEVTRKDPPERSTCHGFSEYSRWEEEDPIANEVDVPSYVGTVRDKLGVESELLIPSEYQEIVDKKNKKVQTVLEEMKELKEKLSELNLSMEELEKKLRDIKKDLKELIDLI